MLNIREFYSFSQEHEDYSPEEFKLFLESKGLTYEDGQRCLFKMASRFAKFMSTGKSNGNIPNNIKQLAAGIVVEKEHCDDFEIQLKIASDHIYEFENYYIPFLRYIEKMMEYNRDSISIKSTNEYIKSRIEKLWEDNGEKHV
jgi:hypothetical protein